MENLFISGAILTLSQIKKHYGDNFDVLHDHIADSTDGTNPEIIIKKIGTLILLLEEETGSTLCIIPKKYFNREFYIIDFINFLYKS